MSTVSKKDCKCMSTSKQGVFYRLEAQQKHDWRGWKTFGRKLGRDRQSSKTLKQAPEKVVATKGLQKHSMMGCGLEIRCKRNLTGAFNYVVHLDLQWVGRRNVRCKTRNQSSARRKKSAGVKGTLSGVGATRRTQVILVSYTVTKQMQPKDG